jgi:A/G-specific adenine glycosylase
MNRIETKRTPSGSWPKNNSENSVNSVKNSTLVTPLLRWFASNARDLPWRRTLDPYAIWVSEIMLQQTQVKTVIPYFGRWVRELPTIEALSNASSEKIHKLWEGLGYYTRVRNMQKAAQVIVEKHDGKFPREFDAVLALPGIGRYTAGAICSIAFNQNTPILDGNVMRVLTRLFGVRENARGKETNEQLWQLAERLVAASARVSLSPPRGEGLRVRGGDAGGHDLRWTLFHIPTPHPVEKRGRVVTQRSEIFAPAKLSGSCSALNQSLMELGATVCTPKQPKCGQCPVMKLCIARRENIVEQLPNLGERTATTARRFVACVIERGGAVLVRQRPEGVVNAQLWEFPNVETALNPSPTRTRKALEAELGCALDALTPLTTVKHAITRYRITLDAFRAEFDGVLPPGGEWIAVSKLETLPFTSAHRRVLMAALRTKNVSGTLAAR